MDLSNQQRVVKLLGSFARHPSHIWRYLSYNCVRRAMPLDLGLPWWSFSAIEAYEAILKESRRVFEWGCGGSTVFAAARGARVVAVEDNGEWMERTRQELERRALSGIEWRHCALPPFVEVTTQMNDYVNALCSDEFDVVIIDGHDRPFSNRDLCFRQAMRHVKDDAVVILDDAWRYPHLLRDSGAKRVDIYESAGPARLGVTSTAFLRY